MRIGEVADRSGVSPTTIRYYEDIGLLHNPTRTPSGYRDYTDAAVARLAFIRAAQSIGLSLGEIREVLTLKAGRGALPSRHQPPRGACRRAGRTRRRPGSHAE